MIAQICAIVVIRKPKTKDIATSRQQLHGVKDCCFFSFSLMVVTFFSFFFFLPQQIFFWTSLRKNGRLPPFFSQRLQQMFVQRGIIFPRNRCVYRYFVTESGFVSLKNKTYNSHTRTPTIYLNELFTFINFNPCYTDRQ